jgi:hypothetical protein
MKVGNKSFENLAKLKYLRMAFTNQNLIQEEIKRKLNWGYTYYHSMPNLFLFPSAV